MKEVIPSKDDVVIQATQISRAAYMMPTSARRIIGLAMARVRIDDVSEMAVEMTPGDVIKALGLNNSAKAYAEIKSAMGKIVSEKIGLEKTNGGYKFYPWFDETGYDPDSNMIQVCFNPKLRKFLKSYLITYDEHAVSDLAKVQGKYSWRIYELVMTHSGMAGKYGNRSGEWYYPELSIGALRQLFMIPNNAYKLTADFRKKVIDQPIAEINKADLGIEITPVYKRRGRYLRGVEFHCRKVARNEPKPATPRTKSERDNADLIEQNRKLYEQFLAEELKQKTFDFGSPEMQKMAAEGRAIERVREAIKSKEIPKKKGAKSGK